MEAATSVASAKAPVDVDRPVDAARPLTQAQDVIALERTDEATWVVPVPKEVLAPDLAAAHDQEVPDSGVDVAKREASKQKTAPTDPASTSLTNL